MRNRLRRHVQTIHRQQDLLATSLHGVQCAELTGPDVFRGQQIGNLNKEPTISSKMCIPKVITDNQHRYDNPVRYN